MSRDALDLPEELRSTDADLRAAGAVGDVPTPPGLTSRISAAVAHERAPTGPSAFAQAARERSARGMLHGLASSARSVFGGGVPLMARLQAIALLVVVSLVLAAGVTIAATGAAEVVRIVQGRPNTGSPATPVPSAPLGPSASPPAAAPSSSVSPAPSSDASPSGAASPSVTPSSLASPSIAPSGSPAESPSPIASPSSAPSSSSPEPSETP